MIRILFIFITFCMAAPVWAQPSSFESSARHAIIMDYDTGFVLYEKGARVATAPASMSKIMTAEIVFDEIRKGSITKDTEFTVSNEAWKRGGAPSGSSTMFLKPGTSVRVEDLLKGVIIQSGNDACIVLAEGLSGSESAFAERMTRRAHEMGLESANFMNATGWPHPDHKISTYDLAQLARYVIRDYPEFYPLYSESEFEWNGIQQANRNPLLGKFPGADGLKTGRTDISGYGLVASAERAGKRRIVVVNGLDSRSARKNETMRLMQAAFERFKIYNIYKSNDVVASAKVYMGAKENVSLVTHNDVNVGLARYERSALKVQVKIPKEIPAPIIKGAPIGELIITAPDMNDVVVPLYPDENIERKSPIGRVLNVLTNLIRG